jgi:hypothetical protein
MNRLWKWFIPFASGCGADLLGSWFGSKISRPYVLPAPLQSGMLFGNFASLIASMWTTIAHPHWKPSFWPSPEA